MALLWWLTGCVDAMSENEIRAALDEVVSSARVDVLAGEIIEISTSFTMGAAVEEAAAELRDWYASQLPCAAVSVEGATLTVDFGTLDDACTWNGHTYAGVARVSVLRNDGQVELLHAWEGLSNGEVTLDGGAEVTWSTADATRTVVHDVTWTDLATGEVVEASGERVQALLDAEQGLAAGIQVDGVRDWITSRGPWHLEIQGVQLRGQDPVPQAGAYALNDPHDKDATLSFLRLDEDTIEVTFTTGWKTRVIQVTSTGE